MPVWLWICSALDWPFGPVTGASAGPAQTFGGVASRKLTGGLNSRCKKLAPGNSLLVGSASVCRLLGWDAVALSVSPNAWKANCKRLTLKNRRAGKPDQPGGHRLGPTGIGDTGIRARRTRRRDVGKRPALVRLLYPWRGARCLRPLAPATAQYRHRLIL